MGFLKILKKIGGIADAVTESPAVQILVPGLPQVKLVEQMIKNSTNSNPADIALGILLLQLQDTTATAKAKPVMLHLYQAIKIAYANDSDFK